MSDGVWWPEFEQWMLAHALDPSDVVEIAWRRPHAGGLAEYEKRPQALEVLIYKRNENGQRYMENGEVATETRIVPMLHLPAVQVTRYR